MPGCAASAARTAAASAPGAIPTTTGLLPFAGNATAITTDMTTGKTKAQKSASGSRTNSRRRASVSWISGRSLIAQVPSGQSHEHVLECAVPGHRFHGAERHNQLVWSTKRDHASVIHDGHPVTEDLGLFHVVRGEEDGPAGVADAAHEIPQ